MPNKSQINEYSSELKRQDKACQFLDASFEVLTTNFRKNCPELLYYNPSHDRFKVPHHSSSISCHSSSHSCIYNFTPVNNAVITYLLPQKLILRAWPIRFARKIYYAPYQARSIYTYPPRTSTMFLKHALPHYNNLRNLLRTTKVYICQKQTKCPENSVSYPIYEAPIARPLISWF